MGLFYENDLLDALHQPIENLPRCCLLRKYNFSKLFRHLSWKRPSVFVTVKYLGGNKNTKNNYVCGVLNLVLGNLLHDIKSGKREDEQHQRAADKLVRAFGKRSNLAIFLLSTLSHFIQNLVFHISFNPL